MIFNDSVGQTEAQTGPFSLFFGGKERFKYMGKNIFRYSRTGIGYLYADPIGIGKQAALYRKLPLPFHGLCCIENYVHEQMVQLLDVAINGRKGRIQVFYDIYILEQGL